MDVMISIILLVVAAALGARRLETEFDRESRSQAVVQTVKQSDYRS
jgi:hypothetical protein